VQINLAMSSVTDYLLDDAPAGSVPTGKPTVQEQRYESSTTIVQVLQRLYREGEKITRESGTKGTIGTLSAIVQMRRAYYRKPLLSVVLLRKTPSGECSGIAQSFSAYRRLISLIVGASCSASKEG
jgi:hypothetical protein